MHTSAWRTRWRRGAVCSRGFERMVAGWKTLDVEVFSGRPSRADADDDEDQDDERRELAVHEDAA